MGSRFLIFVFGSLLGLALSVAHPTSPDDPVLGTWKLNVEKSKFVPGPGWQSQTRVYQMTPAGVWVIWTGTRCQGREDAGELHLQV